MFTIETLSSFQTELSLAAICEILTANPGLHVPRLSVTTSENIMMFSGSKTRGDSVTHGIVTDVQVITAVKAAVAAVDGSSSVQVRLRGTSFQMAPMRPSTSASDAPVGSVHT